MKIGTSTSPTSTSAARYYLGSVLDGCSHFLLHWPSTVEVEVKIVFERFGRTLI